MGKGKGGMHRGSGEGERGVRGRVEEGREEREGKWREEGGEEARERGGGERRGRVKGKRGRGGEEGKGRGELGKRGRAKVDGKRRTGKGKVILQVQLWPHPNRTPNRTAASSDQCQACVAGTRSHTCILVIQTHTETIYSSNCGQAISRS